MFVAKSLRYGGVLALSWLVTACATMPSAFDRHEWETQGRLSAADAQHREYCPVVVSNRTTDMIDAGYRLDGVSAQLGTIPEGGSASFDVHCAFGAIEAYATTDMGVIAGPGQRFRKRARLDRSGVTRVDFWGGVRGH